MMLWYVIPILSAILVTKPVILKAGVGPAYFIAPAIVPARRGSMKDAGQ